MACPRCEAGSRGQGAGRKVVVARFIGLICFAITILLIGFIGFDPIF
jgi:hypothetical protein